MKTKTIAGLTLATFLTGLTGAAHAGFVDFTPDSTTLSLGQTVTFTYAMDFTDDATYGGGTDFWYDDSVLQFTGWSFNTASGLDNDPFYHRDPTDCVGANNDPGCGFDANEFGPGLAQLNGMQWGNDSNSGMTGPEVIGFMTFLAVGEGTIEIFMAANDDGIINPDGTQGNPGPFVSANTNAEQNVDFYTSAVTVSASQVPLPAAAWLMLGGLGALGGLRRKA